MRLARITLFAILPGLLLASEAGKWCESSPEIRKEMQRLDLPNLKGHEREQARKKIGEELVAKYPDDLFIEMRYQQIAGGEFGEDREAVIDRYRKLAAEHAGDSFYEFLYANALEGKDTPQTIKLSQEILAKDPNFVRAHLLLADVYAWGKFADHEKAHKQLDAFFESCPTTLDDRALSLAEHNGDQELAAKIVPRLRERLADETDPQQLKKWERVWNLEFKAHPVSEHDQIRKEIADELGKLQEIQSRDASWLLFLKNGYHMAGNEAASKKEEAKLLDQYPQSEEAQRISREDWEKTHPWPGSDEAKQKEYWRANLKRAEEGLKKSPNDEDLLWNRFMGLANQDGTSTDQLYAAGEAFLAEFRKQEDWLSIPTFEMQVAQQYLKHKIHPEEAPSLVQEGWKTYSRFEGVRSDRTPDEFKKMQIEGEASMKRDAALILLDAAEQLHKPEIAKDAVMQVEPLKPEKPYEKSSQWQVEAKWAELQGRKLDALLMYRAALDARPVDHKPSKDDELAQSEDRLWKELGGTDAGRALLANKPKPTEAAENGQWEKPDKEMKSWQLSDLEGKSWKLTSLEGKTVLINVWATWCGPCKAEHPHLQKLYESLKGDPGVQIVTFNVDDEIGNVAPYMKENKYTFPVLLAKDYVDDLLPALSIPRNWIIDANGKWQWEQIGFGSGDKWEDEMRGKLKGTQPATSQ